MKKTVSPELHCIVDYILVGSLLTVPALLGFDKKVKELYMAEALALLGYVALTDSPVAVKPLTRFLYMVRLTPLTLVSLLYKAF